ncbi:MAG: hypothetical protein Q8M19_12100, partial [Reyranella sp.]|nr:hypothetical protein [Reyranella sp.]
VEIADRLAQAPADIPDVHPNVSNIYRKNVVRFTEALDDPDGGREAAQALRSLIGKIVLTPGKKRGEVHAELRGELMGILEFADPEENQRTSHFMPAVDAGPRNHLNFHKGNTSAQLASSIKHRLPPPPAWYQWEQPGSGRDGWVVPQVVV